MDTHNNEAEAFEDSEAELADALELIVKEQYEQHINDELGSVPRPINFRTLQPGDLEVELLALNAWVDWLRHEYGLPAQIVPPMWHRHPELVWELSALRQYWLFSYDPQAKGNQAVMWHHEFAAARERLRDWVTISGTRLDRDRPTRVTPWPGGESEDWTEPDAGERPVSQRTNDFLDYVHEQVTTRVQNLEAASTTVVDENAGGF
ncbi:hypothetical protein GCM10022198_19200 [Klugiella xanthotipulae]|uniref:DUF4913 domain-containing protein n=1 Tax=Klugiella xanthotipulae TaxID=244735 RepID=A0A543HS07_9MICO|nr:hypothetical protein [Klugiella xanthotipulae]TQM61120.1 hypothetical protein FB466_2051 [Klugiella xanthotipulae]